MKKHYSSYPFFPEEDIDKILTEIKQILIGEKMLTMSDNVKKFEQEFAAFCGTKYAVVTNSCSSALEVCLNALNLSKDDEVIVPAQTFIATGASVLRAGATIVFCDTDRNFLLDFESLKSKITSNTKAVIIVHFAGLISKDVFKIKKYLEERNIVLIEDAAHAHGAVMDQIKAGNIGDFGCFSFYSTKIMTAGEGGIITTNNNSYYKKCASIRNRGIDSDFDKKECFINLGSNYRMTEIQAILCRTQLDRLPEFLLHRKRIAAVYKNELKDLIDSKKLRLQNYDGNNGHSYWRFIVFLNDGLDRDHIKSKMQAKNIIVDAPYDPLLHQQPLFKNKEVFQNADYYCNHHISLPIHMLVSVNDAVFIAKSLRESICE